MVQQVPLPENSVAPGTRAAWRRWLERHHADSKGVWVVAGRRPEGRALSHHAVLEEALCFGWGGQRTRALDDERRLAWVAPRAKKAGWSRADKELVARLTREGRMHAAGRAAVKAAKAAGSWALLDDVEAMVVPADLEAALAQHDATAEFARLAPSARRHALEWIHSARRAPTRAARIAETARLAKMGIVMTQWRLDSRR